jgi:hypothetical protein
MKGFRGSSLDCTRRTSLMEELQSPGWILKIRSKELSVTRGYMQVELSNLEDVVEVEGKKRRKL